MNDPREIAVPAVTVPASIGVETEGYAWARDTVGQSGGSVYRLYATGRPDLYLKYGAGEVADAIVDEMTRARWLGRFLSVPSTRTFVSTGDEAWLLMAALPGRTAYQVLTEEPSQRIAVVSALAVHLQQLHAITVDRCPFDSRHHIRMRDARRRMDAGVVDTDDFGDAHRGWTADRVWQDMTSLLPLPFERLVTHGDYSLDNILIVDGRVAGCIDLGRVGVADPYQDLAILWDSLGEIDPALQTTMVARYGISEPDMARIRFHLCLDEMF